jgi:hypothetical protein
LVVGILVGSLVMFFFVVKVAERAIDISERNASQQETQAYLDCLKMFDRGTTNDLAKFQLNGRMILSNYLGQIQKLTNEDYYSMFTNSPTYQQAQKYLAH